MLIQMNLLIWEFLKSYLLFLFSHSVMPTLWEPWTTAQQASLSFTIFQSLLKLLFIESVMPSNNLILCCALFLLSLIFPSIRVFSSESLFTSGGQNIGASASVLPMNIQDWFPLVLTGFISLQSKGLSRVFSSTTVHSKASVLWRSAFFMVQLSYRYMTTGKTIALTIQTFVGKAMSLLFMLSRLVIAFLPRNKHLLISQLQSSSAVILEPKENEFCHCFHCFPIYMPRSDGTICHDLSFLKF